MFLFLPKMLWALAGPSALLLALLTAGALLSWTRWRRTGRWLTTAAAFAALAVTILPLHSWLLAPLEERFPPPRPLPVQVEGIIVLGGAIDPVKTAVHGVPSLNDAAERLTEFAKLARHYPSARLVFTGGSVEQGAGGVGEAEATRQLLAELGLDTDRILFEGESRNTFENAAYTKRLMAPLPGQTWILVTSASHMPRAVGVFRSVGWPVLAWPVAYKSGGEATINLAEHLTHLEWAVHEWLGLAAYRLEGRTDSLLPAP